MSPKDVSAAARELPGDVRKKAKDLAEALLKVRVGRGWDGGEGGLRVLLLLYS
jgi:hypothetical protein